MPVNRLLTDDDREALDGIIFDMWGVCKETMRKKIQRANVQQAFVLHYVLHLIKNIVDPKILSVGCFEDTAYEYLRKQSIDLIGIDPQINYDLRTYINNGREPFDIVFATSVLEHVEDDEGFISDMCKLLKPYGYGILTVDFNNNYRVGDPLPKTDLRFYTKHDLEFRLTKILTDNGCDLVDTPDWTGEPEFTHDGCNYSFSTFVFRKESL